MLGEPENPATEELAGYGGRLRESTRRSWVKDQKSSGEGFEFGRLQRSPPKFVALGGVMRPKGHSVGFATQAGRLNADAFAVRVVV